MPTTGEDSGDSDCELIPEDAYSPTDIEVESEPGMVSLNFSRDDESHAPDMTIFFTPAAARELGEMLFRHGAEAEKR